MTTKMILIHIDRLKTLEKISTDTPAKLPADVEFNCYNKTRIYAHVLGNQNRKKKYQWIVPCTICKNRKARIKRTFDHMAEHDGNIKYDKYTSEIQYDGVEAPDSDVRELLSTLTSKKEAYNSQGVGSLYELIKGYGRTGRHTSRVEVE